MITEIRTVGLLTFATINGAKARKLALQYGILALGGRCRFSFKNEHFAMFLDCAKVAGLVTA